MLMGPNATAAHQQQLNEDNRQALVLFGIVLIFFVSNVPRILLNLHEVSWYCWLSWHYRSWSFQDRDTKLGRFLAKNQHTQKKLLNFDNWTNGEPQ